MIAGAKKIPEPITLPTMMVVASKRPRPRTSPRSAAGAGLAGPVAVTATSALGLEVHAEYRLAGQVVQAHGQHLRLGVDPSHAEELQPVAGRAVRLQVRRDPAEAHLGPERVVEGVRAEGARVQGAGHELPERVEFLEAGPLRLVVVGGRIVDVA